MAGFSRAASASLSLLLLFLGLSAAKQVLVGGKENAWKIPSSQSDSLNQWAQRSRFQAGDYLVWKYDGGKDSVLQVSREDYVNCSTSNPIKEYNDGNTKVKLDRPGPFYFISGAKGHCEEGQKLVVFEGPAVAPTSSASALQGGLLMAALGVLMMWAF
ncbi:early nodulin-like protein 1 [Senna tora]|uniref:Early nodulin-like protein 1 n=1 Tax=Senna tora TaxID=362788 RepID=A0A834WSL9_9FABA|nr:early nodulin-like protein 1 [Senna tora]